MLLGPVTCMCDVHVYRRACVTCMCNMHVYRRACVVCMITGAHYQAFPDPGYWWKPKASH